MNSQKEKEKNNIYTNHNLSNPHIIHKIIGRPRFLSDDTNTIHKGGRHSPLSNSNKNFELINIKDNYFAHK